jgi:hypothetical protein
MIPIPTRKAEGGYDHKFLPDFYTPPRQPSGSKYRTRSNSWPVRAAMRCCFTRWECNASPCCLPEVLPQPQVSRRQPLHHKLLLPLARRGCSLIATVACSPPALICTTRASQLLDPSPPTFLPPRSRQEPILILSGSASIQSSH